MMRNPWNTFFIKMMKMMNKTKLNILLDELEESRKQSAYSQNHLLNTIISRVEELILNKIETNISIGF